MLSNGINIAKSRFMGVEFVVRLDFIISDCEETAVVSLRAKLVELKCRIVPYFLSFKVRTGIQYFSNTLATA